MDFLADYFLWFKALHIIAMVAWMAGLFYLPRLYAYHTQAKNGSETDATFQVMERKLLRYIMNPAMIATFIFGFLMLSNYPIKESSWLHTKITLVFVLAGFHGYLAVIRKKFANGLNTKSGKFYRLINEVPTVILIAIVLLAVLKP